MPDAMPCGRPWPRVSIITPSYNQGRFIEETIRSVLLQGYPDLEYIIMDGGSTDNTVAIIKKYEQFLAHWVSEPDRGQAHAVNKGIERATGGIVGWINSDDVYTKAALGKAVNAMYGEGEGFHTIVFGGIQLIDEHGHILRTYPGIPVKREKLIRFWRQEWHIPQPAVFFQSHILRENPLKESLHYAMDWELYLRLLEGYPFRHLPLILVRFRSHTQSKTSGGWKPFTREQLTISRQYWGERYASYLLDYCLWPLTRQWKALLGLLRRVLKMLLGDRSYGRAKALKAALFKRGMRAAEDDLTR